MSKVGIITYHAAYNYGSVLQAYALQEMVRVIGHDVQIINYRPLSQKKFYAAFRIDIRHPRSTWYGLSTLLRINEKIKKGKRFEEFISKKINLTHEINNLISLEGYSYDVLISGSDQILSYYTCEFSGKPSNGILPYYLYGFPNKKISYASCSGLMSQLELTQYHDELSMCSSLSARDEFSSKKIGDIVNKEVPVVLDPTLLFSSEEWERLMNISCEAGNYGNYILLYTLDYTPTIKEYILRLLENQKTEKEIIVISPYAYVGIKNQRVRSYFDLGPDEFYKLIKNAFYVITDSYHGTLFSVNLMKNFWTIQEEQRLKKNNRQLDILKRLGMEKRIIKPCELSRVGFDVIDFDHCENSLKNMRKESKRYLVEAIDT